MIAPIINMKRPGPLLTILFLLGCLKGFAQNKTDLITGVFKDLSTEQFVKQIETISAYHFFYDQRQFDSLRINLEVKEEPLPLVLEQVFKNSDYHFVLREKLVYLMKGKQILTGLPEQFTGREIKPEAPGERPLPLADLASEKAVPVATLENKLYEIGSKPQNPTNAPVTITGYIRNIKTGEAIINANIYVEGSSIKTSTDRFGFYSLTLPAGRHILNIREISMRDTRRIVMLYSGGKLNIDLTDQVFSLKEVVISSTKAANINSNRMGVEKLDIATIKQVPTVFGEADVLKVVLTLPGVKSVGEASTGFNVRGGAVDQNLILFNDATIYNPSHFFGFFSAFNPDIVKDVELYKSSIPSRFGGRLSSVLEVTTREGNKKKFTGTAGLGLLTSRVNIEGPIIPDKTSFILGARTTYSNWLLQALPSKSGYKDARASFYDLNLNISHQINDKNNLYLTGYISNDKSNLGSDTSFSYDNKNISLKWKHVFNDKFYGVFTTGADNYQYNNFSDYSELNAYRLKFSINQTNLKADFNYFISNRHTLDFGLNSIYYKLRPGSFQPFDGKSLIIPDLVPAEQGLESALYIGDQFDITPKLSLNTGIRYSLFNSLGPQDVDSYTPGMPRDETTVAGTTSFGSGKIMKTYGGPEFRISGRYIIKDDLSVKAGYNTSRQYIHLLTNTSAISPTDIWKLSDPNIKPQFGQQVSLGLYKNFKSNTIETSVEGYYKKMSNYLDYKSGATLVLNHNIERDVISTEGKAYGVEFLIKKLTGKLNGWLSYTYSRTLLKADDATAQEKINEGRYYPANVDKPHDISFVGNYRLSHRYSISLNTAYSTGRPITYPVARYYYSNSYRVYYSDRNAYRIPDYFRTDFSINLEGNHKVNQLAHSSWTLGIYNITGRKNAYSNYFTSENGNINGYKLVIFGSPVPFINYNIRFN